MVSLQVLYASTSGHTRYVAETVIASVKEARPEVEATLLSAEEAGVEDLSKGNVLVLAASTWNTGGEEGRLNPHMLELLADRAKDVTLAGRTIVVIGLGDDRYRYKARAADEMEEFVTAHGGILAVPTLRIVNEPFGQEGHIREWAAQLLPLFSKQ